MIDISERRHPRRRAQRQGPRRRRPAARDRLRDPADRAVPAPHDRRQRRHRPAPAGLGQASAIADRVEELIDLIGLPQEMAARYPAQLSGGQRQRVGVARALAADPPLMLMDEPFGAIDPINRERLQNEFLRLQAEIRKTIVFVTHDIDEAIKMGDRIAILQVGGKLAQYAPPEELLMEPASPFVEDFVGADRALKAPQPAARARRRPVARGAGAGRRAGGRGAAPDRGRRHRHPAARRRRRPPARLAGRARADRRARARGAALRPGADRRARRHPARRAQRPARPRLAVRAGGRRHRQGRRRALDGAAGRTSPPETTA